VKTFPSRIEPDALRMGPARKRRTPSGRRSLQGKGLDDIDGASGDGVLMGGQGIGDYLVGPGDDYVLDTGTDTSHDNFSGDGGYYELIDRAGDAFMADDAGRDVLRAGHGNDDLVLTHGADQAWAGPGDDVVQVDVDNEVDRVSCGPGNDTVQFKRREPAEQYWSCKHFKVFP